MIRELDFPGKRIEWEFDLIDHSAHYSLSVALDAMFRFCKNFITPLVTDLTICYYNKEYHFSMEELALRQKYWFIIQEFLPSGVERDTAWENTRVEKTEVIDPAALHAWVLKAINNENCFESKFDTSVYVSWQELLIRAVSVTLPYSCNEIPGNALTLLQGASSITYPVENHHGVLYAHGPLQRKTILAPFQFQILNHGEYLSMGVYVFWSLWTDKSEKGWIQLKYAIQQVADSGWKCKYCFCNKLC